MRCDRPEGQRRARNIDTLNVASTVQKTMEEPVATDVRTNDLPKVIDSIGYDRIDRCEMVSASSKSMEAGLIRIGSDDLARVIYSEGERGRSTGDIDTSKCVGVERKAVSVGQRRCTAKHQNDDHEKARD